MKILTVINKLDVGGAENLSVDLCNHFLHEKYRVDVLALKDADSFVKRKLKDDVQYRFLTTGNIYNPLLIFRLIGIVKKYDIVHVHLFPAIYWVIIASFFGKGQAKIVFSEHSVFNRRRNSGIFRMLDRFLYRSLDKIICVSEGARQALLGHIGDDFDSKIIVINNGIDITKFKHAPKTHNEFFKKDAFVVMQVSSFRPQKDQQTLIASMLNLPETIKLILVGDGELRKGLEIYVKENKLSERVKFLGARSDVESLLQLSDVVVLSSKHESFGIAIVEGMAAGKPVIASDIVGLREIVCQYGLLFEKGNYKHLSELIRKLYSDREFYNEISMRCASRAEMYSLGKTVDKHVTLFNNLLK